MPMRSRHFPISFEEWERLPRPPGWKHEYFNGCAHVTPNYQHALTTASVAPRPVDAPCALRPVVPEDEASLLAVYLEAFADDSVFCDYSDEQFREEMIKRRQASKEDVILGCPLCNTVQLPKIASNQER